MHRRGCRSYKSSYPRRSRRFGRCHRRRHVVRCHSRRREATANSLTVERATNAVVLQRCSKRGGVSSGEASRQVGRQAQLKHSRDGGTCYCCVFGEKTTQASKQDVFCESGGENCWYFPAKQRKRRESGVKAVANPQRICESG